MKNLRRLVTALSVTAAAVLSTCAGAASAAEPEGDGTPRCAMLVDKAPEGGVSPVLAKVCSDTHEKAIAGVNAEYRRLKGISASATGSEAAGVVIMEWYKNVDYYHPYTTIVGWSGPCDTAGYRVEPNDEWKGSMSSILGYNGCDKVRVTNRALTSAREFTAFYNGEAHWLGAYSDNVGLTQAHA